MRTHPRSKPSRMWRFAMATASTAAAIAMALPVTTALAATDGKTTSTDLRRAGPFLFNYTFNGHLKIAGGNFTVGGRVYLVVKYNTGRVAFSKQVIAQPHSITPGGAIYVETTIAAPCAGWKNGYARAYAYATQTWSPRLPVEICQRID